MGWLAECDGDRPRIARLVVHEEVGEGGFGVVYRATETREGRREVALKCLKPGLDTRAILQRFSSEQQALARLRHPNIARFYDSGRSESGHPWFTMEYLPGPPIHEALRDQDWQAKSACFLKICEAVSFAHEAGILHRDLKPANILMTESGEPKVIDFGIARALEAEPGMTCYTADEIAVGTPRYQAPEDKALMDERSDLYALSRTFFEILTTTPSPKGGRLSLPSVEFPRALGRVLSKASDPEPSERYDSVVVFAEDLKRVMAGERVAVTQRRSGRWLCVGVAVLIAALLVWRWTSENQVSTSGATALAEVEKLYSSGNPFRLRFNRDGTRGLAVFRANGRAILFDPQTGREISSVAGRPEGLGDGRFSEEGKRFLVTLSDGHFQWYSASDGRQLSEKLDATPRRSVWLNNILHVTIAGESEPTVLINNTDHHLMAFTEAGVLRWEVPLVREPYSLAVNPAGGFAVVGSGDGRLQIIDLRTQERRVLLAHTQRTYHVAWCSDGKFFGSVSDDGTCHLWDADGDLQWVGHHDGKCREVAFSPDNRLLASSSWDGTARLWDVETGENN